MAETDSEGRPLLQLDSSDQLVVPPTQVVEGSLDAGEAQNAQIEVAIRGIDIFKNFIIDLLLKIFSK